MTFSSDVKVVEDFTDDRDLLAKDIKDLTIGEGQGFDVSNCRRQRLRYRRGLPAGRHRIQHLQHRPPALRAGNRGEDAGLAEREEGAGLLRQRHARKRHDNQAQLQATVNAAIRANVSFYPIDARGLVASAPLGDATKGSPGGTAMYYRQFGALRPPANFQGQQETLSTLAADTGGKALLDNNDLAMGIVQAQKDISSYYILGYYPTNDKLDGAVPPHQDQPAAGARGQIRRAQELSPGLFRGQGIQ